MYVVDQENGNKIEVEIVKANPGDLPLKKDGWKFNWKAEYKKANIEIYMLRQLDKKGNDVEAVVSLRLVTQDGKKHEHIQMVSLEVAPHNYGSEGKYDRTAGCLIAHACEASFMVENAYKGWVMFEAKTEIVDLYIDKYGAIVTMATNPPIMCFSGKASIALIQKYLN